MHRNRMAVVRITLVVTGLMMGAASALLAQSDFTDRVGTLQLSEELDSRGNLGGITVDRLGFVYVANFRDAVWRISPEGDVVLLSRSLYGSSGNAVDSRGDLYQSNFFGNTITRITRSGEETRFADHGLEGPVGIAVGEDDTLYVCNCNGNYIATVSPTGEVARLAEGDLFACPNGIVFGADEHLYVTNFNNPDIIRVSPAGEATNFTSIAGGAGNAHITFSRDFFYVTKIIANQLVKVSADGEIFPIVAASPGGHEDGSAAAATLARPNGITVSPTGDLLYINTLDGDYNGGKPARMTIRTVELMTLTKALDRAWAEGGVEAMAAAYTAYGADPVRGRENTVAEMIAYGYRNLQTGKVPEALTVFQLNASAHPAVAAAQYQLGEAFRYTGQTEAAVGQYRQTLELEPEHQQARARLAQLGAE